MVLLKDIVFGSAVPTMATLDSGTRVTLDSGALTYSLRLLELSTWFHKFIESSVLSPAHHRLLNLDKAFYKTFETSILFFWK